MTLQDQIPDSVLDSIRAHRQRFTWLGVALVVLGILAILFPLVASIAAKVLVGWFFLMVGAATLYHAFQTRGWQSTLWSALIGVLNLAVGVYLAFFPLTGLIGLTFLAGIMFLVQGALEETIAFQHRPRTGWLWLAFSGLASLILGVLLIAGLPGTALWAIGMLVGLNALSSGVSFIALARSV